MRGKVNRLFDDLKAERDAAFIKPMDRALEILQHAAGLDAARAAQTWGEAYLEGDREWPPSDVLPGPLREAFRRWSEAGEMLIPPPPSDVLPIPKIEAEVWDAARREFNDGDVSPLLQLSCLRAYREVHGPADRVTRQHISAHG